MIINNGVLVKIESDDIKDGILIIPEDVKSIGPNVLQGISMSLEMNMWLQIERKGVKGLQIVVPGELEKIDDSAFESSAILGSIELQKGVRHIGKNAFKKCGLLKKVIIEQDLEEIGDSAFEQCSILDTLEIPRSITSVGEKSFYGCSKIANIDLGDSIENIGNYAFSQCTTLSEIKLPDTLEKVGKGIFKNCYRLQKNPENIPNITSEMFEGCTQLKTIEFPSKATQIGERAFYGCILLRKVDIPPQIQEIADYAFGECSQLTSTNIPEGITEIGKGVFLKCGQLKEISLPSTITEIGEQAFMFCKSLTEIELPESVTKIGTSAFKNCFLLSNIDIPEQITKIEDETFEGCLNLDWIYIPEQVQEIGRNAFRNCATLNNIEIPENIVQIGQDAFSNCSGLTKMSIPFDMLEIFSEVITGTTKVHSLETEKYKLKLNDGKYKIYHTKYGEIFSGLDTVLFVYTPQELIKNGVLSEQMTSDEIEKTIELIKMQFANIINSCNLNQNPEIIKIISHMLTHEGIDQTEKILASTEEQVKNIHHIDTPSMEAFLITRQVEDKTSQRIVINQIRSSKIKDTFFGDSVIDESKTYTNDEIIVAYQNILNNIKLGNISESDFEDLLERISILVKSFGATETVEIVKQLQVDSDNIKEIGLIEFKDGVIIENNQNKFLVKTNQNKLIEKGIIDSTLTQEEKDKQQSEIDRFIEEMLEKSNRFTNYYDRKYYRNNYIYTNSMLCDSILELIRFNGLEWTQKNIDENIEVLSKFTTKLRNNY